MTWADIPKIFQNIDPWSPYRASWIGVSPARMSIDHHPSTHYGVEICHLGTEPSLGGRIPMVLLNCGDRKDSQAQQ